ncbi:hypothetical protein ADEAN_000517400 [Angomonas deanei]|uniref:Uncharacterized protein n=1 Tax=Angomonas deanei TaxID=59799 RepID=A0A7G2CFN9_9TRYP|nr:hypothetical protein ADEAN_000517400 [Angomonas deanei]
MDLWLPWMELLHVDRRLPRPWKVLSIGRGQGKSRSLSHEKGASPEIRSMCSMVWEHRPNSRPDEICSSEFLVDYVSRYVTSKENFNLFHPCRTPYLKVPNTRNSFDYVYLIGFAPLVTLFMPATYIFYMIFIAFHSSGGYMFAGGPDGEPEWYTVNKRTYRRYRDVAPVALLYAFGLPVLLAFCFRDIVNRPWRQACLENVLGVLGSFIWLVASPLLYLVKLTLEPPYDLALDLECSGVLREKFRECVYLTSDEQKGFLTDFSNYPRSYLVHNRLQRREEQIGYLRETGNSMYYTFPLTHLQLGIIFMGGVGISVVGHYISYARSVGNGHWTAALCCFFCAPVGSLQESTGVYVYRPSIWVYLLLFAASLILFGHYFDGPLSDERFDEPRFHYILLFVPTFVAVVLYAVVPLLIWVVHGICKRASLTVTAASDTILPAVIALVPTYQNFCSSYWFALVVGLVYFLSSMFGLVFGILSLERYWRSILIPRWLTTEVFQPSYVVLILLPLWPLPMIMMIVMLGYFGSNVAVVRFVRQVCKVKRP